MVNPQKNNYDIEKSINYESYLKHNKLNSNKTQKYFYQRSQVKDSVDSIKEEIINNNLSGKKRYTKPLIKNQKLNISERNIDIDSITRGQFSRLDNPNFQKNRESLDDMRLPFLNKNFQDPNKLVLPFARGGEMTREKYSKNN